VLAMQYFFFLTQFSLHGAGRAATTCSLYIQGNVSHPYRLKEPQTGRTGDARVVFGLFKGSNPTVFVETKSPFQQEQL
jgi:hypothetical protein